MASEKKSNQTISITNEKDAFFQLQRALASEFDDQPINIEFKNWPILIVSLEGKGYDSTITSHMAEALVELQHAMNRTFARVTVDLSDYATKIVSGLVGKMDGTQLVMLTLGTAVIAGSTLAYKAFLKHRSEDKKVELATQERIGLSQEETKRLVQLQQIMTVQPKLEATRQDFDDARYSLIKSVGDANTLKVQGVELNRAEAKSIASTPRSTSDEVQLNGHYRIDKLDWTKAGEVRISVWSTDESREFTAKLNTESLNTAQKEMLKKAEWERKNLHLQVNATQLRGEITTATIVGIEWPKEGLPANLK